MKVKKKTGNFYELDTDVREVLRLNIEQKEQSVMAESVDKLLLLLNHIKQEDGIAVEVEQFIKEIRRDYKKNGSMLLSG